MMLNGFAGTWKLNLAKSDTPPVTRSQILTIHTDGVNVSMQEELVNERTNISLLPSRGSLIGAIILSPELHLPTRYRISC